MDDETSPIADISGTDETRGYEAVEYPVTGGPEDIGGAAKGIRQLQTACKQNLCPPAYDKPCINSSLFAKAASLGSGVTDASCKDNLRVAPK